MLESNISFSTCLTGAEYSIIHSLLRSSSSTGAAWSDLREATHNVPDLHRGNKHKRSAMPDSTGFFMDNTAKLQKEACFEKSFALTVQQFQRR